MSEIYGQIELSNKRYDHSKIQENIDATNKILASTPKVITVKNSHHFGSWTTSFIIGVTISFFLVAGSVLAIAFIFISKIGNWKPMHLISG